MLRYFNYKNSISEVRANPCFEYEDKEFIYKLCLFGKISQISKTNQRSRNLGLYNYEAGSTWVYNKGDRCAYSLTNWKPKKFQLLLIYLVAPRIK